MLDFIIDLFNCLRLSFSSKGRIRKLAGAGAGIIVLSIVFACFTTWVSMPRYADILQGLSENMAWTLSGGIALVLFFTISLAAYLIYGKMKYQEDLPKYFAFLCIVIISLAGFDMFKNFEGSTDRAQIAEVKNPFFAQGARLPYAAEIAELKAEKKAIHNEYRYRGGPLVFRPQPHTRHSKGKWNGDKARVSQIDSKIGEYEGLQAKAIEVKTSQIAGINFRNNEKQSASEKGLRTLSIAVYLIQFVLAFCWVAIMDALEGREVLPTKSHGPAPSLASHIIEKVKDATSKPKPATAEKGKREIGFKTIQPEKLEPEKVQRMGVSIREDSYKRAENDTGKIAELEREITRLKEQMKNRAKSGGFRHGQDTHTITEKSTVDLGSTAPKFSRVNQPTQYRGIDEKQYRKFLEVARDVLAEKGRYVKTEISRKTWKREDRRKVGRYLKAAFERGDLSNE